MTGSGACSGAQVGEDVSESPLKATLLAMQAEGYSAIDLNDLAVRAMHQAAVQTTTPKVVDVNATVRTLCQNLHLGRRRRMSEGEAHARLRE